MKYETIIGLEVHVELATNTKIFCGCSTQFGADANTQCCPICLGMPGTLPVLNKKVVEYAIRAGLATNCNITQFIKLDRKNYYYPDLPKSYQISQLYFPLCTNGYIEIPCDEKGEGTKRVRIKEIHMEEDSGKLIHDSENNCSLVDYNRAGVPLIEIVSEPDMRSSKEAVDYLMKLRNILRYIGVSDCKMQEGSFRADINLSVRPKGETKLGVRTEMKNLNSFKAITRAIDSERNRQIELLESGKNVIQETRRWDDRENKSFPMRTKENAKDYRYFPEPDIPPMTISSEWIENIKANLPLLPNKKKKEMMEKYGLSEYDADLLTSDKMLVEIFDEATKICDNPKEVANWILGELLRLVKEGNRDIEELNFPAESLGKLVLIIDKGLINRTTAKEVFEKIFTENVDPDEYVKKNNLIMISDEETINETILNVLDKNEKSVYDYKNGKKRAFSFLVGQVMKEFSGRVDPKLINSLLKRVLDERN